MKKYSGLRSGDPGGNAILSRPPISYLEIQIEISGIANAWCGGTPACETPTSL